MFHHHDDMRSSTYAEISFLTNTNKPQNFHFSIQTNQFTHTTAHTTAFLASHTI